MIDKCPTCGCRPVRPFDEVFARHTLLPGDREALVWHLAAMRARKTVEALLPGPVNDVAEFAKAMGAR